MKILFTHDGIHRYASGAHDAVGGAERQQWYLARALAAAGWSVLVAVRGTLRVGERCTLQGVDFLGIDDAGHVLLSWRRLLLDERPDWWFWRTASHLYGPAVAIAKETGVGTIFSTAFDRDVRPRDALSWRRRWWLLYACGLTWTDRILVQHKGQMSTLPSRWRRKARIVPSIAVAPPHAKPHADREPYVAWVAMLRQPKRPDLLIEIVRRLPDTRFIVCGGPTTHRSPEGYGQRIVSALRDQPNVEYLGQVAPEKAVQIVEDAAILLSTSDEEGFPNTFLEAWAAGTPVVSLTVDPAGVMRDCGIGAVSGGVEVAVRDVGTLLASPWKRDDIGVLARQYVQIHHGVPAVVAAFEGALEGAP